MTNHRFLYDLTLAATVFFLATCATTSGPKRVWLDSSTHSEDSPAWVTETKTAWEKDGKIFVRATHTIRGDERVNSCFDLARLDAKEKILSEIATDLKGSIDNAQTSISENAEVVLGKVRSGQFEGRIVGLKFPQEYYERYRIQDVERVDCHMLGEIDPKDYQKMKAAVLDRVAAADPRLKEAIVKKQVDFLKPAQDRTPAESGSENQN